MSTWNQIRDELRELGYTGPVSYPKPELEKILAAEKAKLTGVVDTGDDDEVKLIEWMGLMQGDLVKVEGENRATFRFRFYYRNPAQEYVLVRGGKKGHERDRCFVPSRIRTMKNKPVLK